MGKTIRIAIMIVMALMMMGMTNKYGNKNKYVEEKAKVKLEQLIQEELDKSWVGIASWYGYEAPNRRTANGERWNPNAVSAAHKTLKFGTILKVTNLANNKTIILKINDRGPYIKGRELDLSKGAAKAIGIYQAGTAKVRMEIIEEEPTAP